MYQLNDKTKNNITEIIGISYEKFVSLTAEEQMKLINKIEERRKDLSIDERIDKVLSKKI